MRMGSPARQAAGEECPRCQRRGQRMAPFQMEIGDKVVIDEMLCQRCCAELAQLVIDSLF